MKHEFVRDKGIWMPVGWRPYYYKQYHCSNCGLVCPEHLRDSEHLPSCKSDNGGNDAEC